MNNRFKIFTLVVLAIVAVITYINPLYPNEQFLQQALALLGSVIVSIFYLFDRRQTES